MKLNWSAIIAISKRDLRSYFSGPTGYVFITLFIFLSAAAAFWQERFFINNLANLSSLNSYFPYILLFFIPALTMNVWSDERRHGTDELLLTLPITDTEVVLGKYLSVLGIYSASLLFSLSHIIVLFWLGSPDLGLMLGNYFGYWMAGVALLAVGMVASLLTTNATVGFVIGALFCSFLVFVDSPEWTVSQTLQSWLSPLGVFSHFTSFSRGVVSLNGIFYFLGIAAVMLYFNIILIGRRHWPMEAEGRKYWMHQAVRAISLTVAVISFIYIIGQANLQIDTTAERLHSISDETEGLIDQLSEDRPILVQAFLSPDVPKEYVETRENIISTLLDLSSDAGDKLQVLIHDTEPYSQEARDAREKFGIMPREVMSSSSARSSTAMIFMGLAFTTGAAEEVIPFFDVGLPVEYELIRSIRVAAKTDRKKVGVLTTGAKVTGGFDFQTMNSSPAWSVVNELKKQYEVIEVSPDDSITADIDGLLAILPSTLNQKQMDNLRDFMISGNPTLLMVDPLPMLNPALSPTVPSDFKSNPFQQQQGPPPEPKGNIAALLSEVGVMWNNSQICWDTYNPHPELSTMPPEVVFVDQGNESVDNAFNATEVISSGLQELVVMYPGYIYSAVGSPFRFTPLIRSGRVSGSLSWYDLVQRGFMGMQLNRNPRRTPSGESYILAAMVSGHQATDTSGSLTDRVVTTPKDVKAIVIADVDIVSEQFFGLRRMGLEQFSFDNVTFVLNSMDILTGDESFVNLRKKRVKHRTLKSVEAQMSQFVERRLAEDKEAESDAETALSKAQESLNSKVAAVRSRTDLDDRAKSIMVQNLQEVENRRFEVVKANIEAEKQVKIQTSKENMESEVRVIQSRIKSLAVVLPPIPVFAIGLVMFFKRRRREIEGAAASRRLRS